jgi:hypothetical protein
MNTTVAYPKNQEPYLAAAGGSSDRPETGREPSSPGAAMSRGDQVAASSACEAGVESQAMKRQRGEDSLLFSCENLQPKDKPSEKQQAGGTGTGAMREENSGLIDVLAMAREAAGATAAPQNSVLPVFTPSVMAPVLVPLRPAGPPAWLRIFMVGSVLALASGLAVLAVYLYRSPRTRTSVPAPIVAAPVAPAAAPVAPVAPATPAAMLAAPSVAGAGTPAGQPTPAAAAPSVAKAVSPAAGHSTTSTRRHSSAAPAAAAAPVAKPAEPVASAPPSQRSKSHRNAGSSGVDLEDLLNGPGGSESGRPARGASVNTTETLPAHLSRNDILTGMRSVQPRVTACYGQYHVPGTATVSMSIAPNGKVQSANVVGSLAGTPSGDCVVRAARAATFARFSGPPMSVQYPFVLR